MFRLEKVFQNDDIFFIKISIIFQAIITYLSIYIFSILEFNSIYDLLSPDIFKNSIYYILSLYLIPIYLSFSFILKNNKKYDQSLIFFFKHDLPPLIISYILCIILFILLSIDFNLSLSFFYLIVFIIFNFFLAKIIINFFYNHLIDENIIQRNIMLVGEYSDISKIVNEHKEKINIYKCCLIHADNTINISRLRSESKIPIFNQDEDIRAILEYHSLGQIWILDNKKNDLNKLLNKVLKFSVDILIIDLKTKLTSQSKNFINDKYNFIQYEISKFHGYKLFFKIISDKILSLFFLLSLSPLILLGMFFIYIEDGFPLFFTQDRTGWDGRRFKIFKLRSLKKTTFDRTEQVKINDKRVLKIGKFIRRFSIDELPQFYNVLIGDMSIVGPRPHMVEHDILYSGLFKNFLKRHKSSPGLTGWAQVNSLRGATPTPEHMRRRMESDLWYLNNWTLWLDYYIILKTFYIVFKKND